MNSVSFVPEQWGWKQDFFSSWISTAECTGNAETLVPARVTGREHHLYELVCPDFSGRSPFPDAPVVPGYYENIRVSGRFEFCAEGSADFPAAGDWVLAEHAADVLRICSVLPRRSALSRGSAGSKTEEQILAANIDMLCLVFALDGGRNFLPRLLERGLSVAHASGAALCIVLNKSDLACGEEREKALALASYEAPGIPVCCVSAKTGEGIPRLMELLHEGDTAGVLGKSGIGKSALVNALASYGTGGTDTESSGSMPSAREGAVRADDLRGRHTTTASRLYRLPSGVLMIDSPGIRELKIWGGAEDIDGGFPDIAEFSTQCRFADCTHTGEPGCAVLNAISTGQLDEERYRAYLELQKEQRWIERRTDIQSQRAEKQKWKQISKFQKELKKRR
jgi:ribosome biogenesis GTPase / thiamine phosphate phosphatase